MRGGAAAAASLEAVLLADKEGQLSILDSELSSISAHAFVFLVMKQTLYQLQVLPPLPEKTCKWIPTDQLTNLFTDKEKGLSVVEGNNLLKPERLSRAPLS